MPDLKSLFFAFNGRIGRRSWWIGTIAVALASVIGTLLIEPAAFDLDAPAPRTVKEGGTLWQLALLVPTTALMVKRFHDRDLPWWVGYAIGALGAVLTIGQYFGFFIPGYTGAMGTAVIFAIGLVFLYALIDNGFLRGTPGPNRYGPDPLAPDPLAKALPDP
jgi:uncharacterized membrane protein YhaH (DUF805 family)